MWFHVVACDYDGTLASYGAIAPETVELLRRIQASGRRLLLITGRAFEDLLAVCPEIELFDLVIAENGAVIFDPRAKQVEDLAAPPPPEFVLALQAAGVPLELGRVIVATVEPHERVVLETIRRLGLELQIIFNKSAVMVLPSGVSKESGLRAALRRLGISAHNTIGIGDGENDHAFLAHLGFSVAVANAVPALAAAADLVTAAPAGAGLVELVDGPLSADRGALQRRRTLPVVTLGLMGDDSPLTYPSLGPNLLVTGKSQSGKSTLTGVLVEQLVRAEYVLCLIDPEGDYRTLAEHEGIVVVASEAGSEEQRAAEVEQLLKHRSTSVAIDLCALTKEEKVRAAAHFLRAVQGLRAQTGAPHWLIIDEAHQLFPRGGSQTQELIDFDWSGICLVTNEPGEMAPEVLAVAQHVLATSLDGLEALLPSGARSLFGDTPLQTGEAVSFALDAATAADVRRFKVAQRVTGHHRHVKKYATGRLEPDRCFHFRGPREAVDLVANNLETFTMLAKGIDEETFVHHLRRGDYARWLRDEIKDPELADEIAALEGDADVANARRATLEAIGRRYTPVAKPD